MYSFIYYTKTIQNKGVDILEETLFKIIHKPTKQVIGCYKTSQMEDVVTLCKEKGWQFSDLYFAISSTILRDKKGNQLSEGDVVLFEDIEEEQEVTIYFGSFSTTSNQYQYIDCYGFNFYNGYHDESLNENNVKNMILLHHKFEKESEDDDDYDRI